MCTPRVHMNILYFTLFLLDLPSNFYKYKGLYDTLDIVIKSVSHHWVCEVNAEWHNQRDAQA